MPRVSICVPNYNYGAFIEQAITSALSQRGVELEVVVVDDASSDDSVRIVECIAATDRRVRLIRHASNRGHIATFNECLFSGRYEYVVKLDADDLLTPGQLARATALMEANSCVGFVYGRVRDFQNDLPANFDCHVRSWTVWSGEDWLKRRCRQGKNVIRQPEVLIRRSVLERVGGHREDLPASSDFNLWLRLAAVSDVGRVNGCDQGAYRVHPRSMQHTIHSGLVNDLRARVQAFDAFFAESGSRLSVGAEFERLARKSLALEALGLACDAYDSGRASSEPVDELRLIAEELDRLIRRTLVWRALERRRRRGTDGSHPSYAFRRAWRDGAARLRWRSWQWRGV